MSPSLAARILERMLIPVWVVDADGIVAFTNDAASSSLGYGNASHLVGRPAHETVHHHRPDGSEYPASSCPVLRPSTTGRPEAAANQWFIRRDGTLFPISWSAAPIELPSGRGTVVAFQDLSADGAWTARNARPLAHAVGAGMEVPSSPAPRRREEIERVTAFVANNAADPTLDPNRLARVHHMSLRTLQLLLAKAGTTPARLIRDQRLLLARQLLVEGNAIAEAARRSGFADSGTFTRAFRRRFGTTPSDYLVRSTPDHAKPPEGDLSGPGLAVHRRRPIPAAESERRNGVPAEDPDGSGDPGERGADAFGGCSLLSGDAREELLAALEVRVESAIGRNGSADKRS